MKKAGGVNACADRHAKYLYRSGLDPTALGGGTRLARSGHPL